MYKGNTMRESYYGRDLVRNELAKMKGSQNARKQHTIQEYLSVMSRIKYNYSYNENDKKFDKWAQANDMLNHTKKYGTPGVVFLYNYRMHWWKYGRGIQEGVFEQAPDGSSFKMGQLAFPGIPVEAITSHYGRNGLHVFVDYQTTIASVRYLREVFGYKVLLFDGQPGGCESPKEAAEDWEATAGHPTCSCDPNTFHIYAEKFVDAVFRQYHCPGLKKMLEPIPLVEIPLGVNWHHKFPKRIWDSTPKLTPLSKRTADFAFLGELENDPSRINMHNFTERLVHASDGCGYLSDHEEGDRICGDASKMLYQNVLLDSIFCPCPRGIKMESFRMTEAIESGCIPIVDDQGMHFNHAWNGIHNFAVTTSRRWAAETFTGEDLLLHVEQLLKDKAALDKRQAGMMAWYAQHKADLVKEIDDTIDYVLTGKSLPKRAHKLASKPAALAPATDANDDMCGASERASCKLGVGPCIDKNRDVCRSYETGTTCPPSYTKCSTLPKRRRIGRKAAAAAEAVLVSKYSQDIRYVVPVTAAKEKKMALIMLTCIALMAIWRHRW
eukprot:gene8771-22002_t